MLFPTKFQGNFYSQWLSRNFDVKLLWPFWIRIVCISVALQKEVFPIFHPPCLLRQMKSYSITYLGHWDEILLSSKSEGINRVYEETFFNYVSHGKEWEQTVYQNPSVPWGIFKFYICVSQGSISLYQWFIYIFYKTFNL